MLAALQHIYGARFSPRLFLPFFSRLPTPPRCIFSGCRALTSSEEAGTGNATSDANGPTWWVIPLAAASFFSPSFSFYFVDPWHAEIKVVIGAWEKNAGTAQGRLPSSAWCEGAIILGSSEGNSNPKFTRWL